MRISWLLGGAFAASLFVVSTAKADTCPADAVFIHGSSASQKIVEAIAKIAVTNNIKIIYSSSKSSCGGGVYDVTHPTGGSYVGTALTSYDTNQGSTCTFDVGRAADIGVSDVYPSSCAGIGGLDSPLVLPADVDDVLGPVQAFTLAVHDDPSYPVAISAEAAFNTLGITGRGNTNYTVTPWTLPADVFGRAEDSGTWQTWARNLGLITSRPVSIAQQTGAGVVLNLLNTSARSSAIGIIALNDIVATGNTAPAVRPLAFKAKGQDFAYYPSSTSTASDLINVRDGHYQTWANLHFLPRKTNNGAYSANVAAVMALLDNQATVAAVSKIRAVPKCAMQVSRASDGGDFSVFAPEKPCGCYFEQQASGTAPASCKTCTDATAATDCGSAAQCVFGFCEAK